jgi:hypothetical protein
MPLHLPAEEPSAGPWHAERPAVVVAEMMRLGHERGAGRRPVVLAIDGRSSGGKTTLAGRLQEVVAGSAIVHTDDIAWWYSPVRLGRAADQRYSHPRALRQTRVLPAHLIDAGIWVQSDERETERRNLARVGQPDKLPTEQDHREWMAEENPFQASQRPWERADPILCGTPQFPFDRANELVIAPATLGWCALPSGYGPGLPVPP